MDTKETFNFDNYKEVLPQYVSFIHSFIHKFFRKIGINIYGRNRCGPKTTKGY